MSFMISCSRLTETVQFSVAKASISLSTAFPILAEDAVQLFMMMEKYMV